MLEAGMILSNTTNGNEALLDELKDSLDEVCRRIAEKFNIYDKQGRVRKAFIIDTLMKHNCYGCIVKVLRQQETFEKVDAIYTENHNLTVNLLVETLRYCFNVNDLPLNVMGELNGNFGRMDIVITPTNTGVILEMKDRLIIIEVKTGRKFSYPQIFRYLLEKPTAVLILWRVTKGHVIVLEGKKLQKLLIAFATVAVHRGLCILKETNVACTHHPCHSKEVVIGNPQELVEDFLKALAKNLPKVVETVFSLLNAEAILRNAK